jgi:hypothetical protein
MRNIKDIWNELENHPDFVTGTFWEVETVADLIQWSLEQEEDYENLSDEELQLKSIEFVRSKKNDLAHVIRKYEGNSYEYESWTSELNFNKLLKKDYVD